MEISLFYSVLFQFKSGQGWIAFQSAVKLYSSIFKVQCCRCGKLAKEKIKGHFGLTKHNKKA
ncbi:hypothetical protein B1202_07490 [Acinetobacter amyesii]|uniref:Uncharacterized protein n=1 Tax=Acinetobacter amyesii TaxID=2942470 RepID=A0A1T1H0S4_9GAMM|nr:hypothetical protein B1202_07490 [Acinetobacter amyesii]